MVNLTIKQIIYIIILLLFITLSGTSYYFYNKYTENIQNIEYLQKNINTLGTNNYELTLNNKELKNYLKDKDTKQKKQVDSLLNLLKVKPKNLISYQHIELNKKDKDTTSVHFNDIKIKNDTLYQKSFESVRKCLKISGIVITTDKNADVKITETEGTNNVYIIKYYKKNFWDYIFFRKGKEMNEIKSDCDSLKYDAIKKPN